MGDAFDDLIPRAEIFRSKLIDDFHLLDSINKGNAEVTKFYSSELSDNPECMDKMLKETPHAVVKFQVCSAKVEKTYDDRRLNRVKTKNTNPYGPWARMIVENPKVQSFLLILILLNSIILGIQAEVQHIEDPSYNNLKLLLDVFDYLSMLVFIVEILLKWVDGFVEFWRDGWNNFDFLVTVMSLIPELIKLSSGRHTKEELAMVAENLRVFRILRSLKMVSRFAQLRIIVLTILKAFKSMVFILALLVMFMYIFAVAGTVMFDSFSKSQKPGLVYRDSFSTLGNSLVTLFQLFTLDHWFAVLSELSSVENGLVSKSFIILWICIGAFIFRNIFAGIMVMNFQNIRKDFSKQCNERERFIEEENKAKMLEVELATQYVRASNTRKSLEIKQAEEGEGSNDNSEIKTDAFPQSVPCVSLLRADLPTNNDPSFTSNGFSNKDQSFLEQARHNFPESSTWNNTVRLNFTNLSNKGKETLWPRDSLFRYFQLMEAMQDNLCERQQLQRLAVLALSNMLEGRSQPPAQ